MKKLVEHMDDGLLWLINSQLKSGDLITLELNNASDIYLSEDGDSRSATIFLPGRAVFLSNNGLEAEMHAETIRRNGYSKVVGTRASLEHLRGHASLTGEEDSIAAYYHSGAEKYDSSEVVEFSKLGECEALYDLHCEIDEFGTAHGSKEMFAADTLESINTGIQRVFGIFKDKKCVSSAISVQYGGYSIVIGVSTLPSERGQGLARKVMAKLALANETAGVKTYLFYNNPAAGRTYDVVGFKSAADWKIMYIS